MTTNPWLDGLALAVSLHNTILLLWLGLTVLFNADRRSWGIWFTGISLLLASAFFFSHSAILGLGLNLADASLDWWWRFGWIPVIVLPFGWYLVTLWYAGFFDQRDSALRRRQRAWFFSATLVTFALLAFFFFANPLPSFAEIANLRFAATPELDGVPILPFIYALDILLCIVLSLDALRRPEPSTRVMGDLARRRARPWLIAAAIILLIVGLVVAGVIFWIVRNARAGISLDNAMIIAVGTFDLIIALLIAFATILIGQAAAAYEVFTGRTLPRRGLLRQWHDAVILAIGFSVVVAASLKLGLHPIYNIFLTTALVTVFYALYGWRSYAERDHYIRDLRPFVRNQHLYDQLTRGSSDTSDIGARDLFRALCRDVLNTRRAFLIAMGPLAPLVPSLSYPDPSSEIPSLPSQFDSPQTICIAVDPARYAGAQWAVPLWSERGLSGVLMLGEKDDGGVYAQEEIEIAGASGGRLIDTIASVELSRRLMLLQRQKLAETQLLDRRARRVLHDDVLPQLHAALLMLNDSEQMAQLLSTAHREISDLLYEMPPATGTEVHRLGLIAALRHTVEMECSDAFDRVTWVIADEVEAEFRTLALAIAETLYYAAREAIRNAARHARDNNRTLNLKIVARISDVYEICVEDDGKGFDNVREQKSGQGLALHSAMMAVVGGSLAVGPKDGGGTRVAIVLPRPDVEKS